MSPFHLLGMYICEWCHSTHVVRICCLKTSMSRLGKFIIVFLPCGPTSNVQPEVPECLLSLRGQYWIISPCWCSGLPKEVSCRHAVAQALCCLTAAWLTQSIVPSQPLSDLPWFPPQERCCDWVPAVTDFSKTSPNCWGLLWVKGNKKSKYNP